jgi:hypothetical protein
MELIGKVEVDCPVCGALYDYHGNFIGYPRDIDDYITEWMETNSDV